MIIVEQLHFNETLKYWITMQCFSKNSPFIYLTAPESFKFLLLRKPSYLLCRLPLKRRRNFWSLMEVLSFSSFIIFWNISNLQCFNFTKLVLYKPLNNIEKYFNTCKPFWLFEVSQSLRFDDLVRKIFSNQIKTFHSSSWTWWELFAELSEIPFSLEELYKLMAVKWMSAEKNCWAVKTFRIVVSKELMTFSGWIIKGRRLVKVC